MRDHATSMRPFDVGLLVVHDRQRHPAGRRSSRALIDTPSGTRLRPPPLSGLKQVVQIADARRDPRWRPPPLAGLKRVVQIAAARRARAAGQGEASLLSGPHTAVLLNSPVSARQPRQSVVSVAAANVQSAEYRSPLSFQARL